MIDEHYASIGRDARRFMLDISVPCHCGASVNERCIGLHGLTVHFGRRLRSLLAGYR